MSEGNGRPTMVSVRLSKAEQDAVRAAAERRGESVSGFVRRVSLTEAGVRRRASVASATESRSVPSGATIRYSGAGDSSGSATAYRGDLSPLPLSPIGRDDRLKIDADPEDALRALLKTRPGTARGSRTDDT